MYFASEGNESQPDGAIMYGWCLSPIRPLVQNYHQGFKANYQR